MRFLADDLPGEALKLLARPEAETIFQVAPRPLVDLECLHMTTRAIERDHELSDEAFAIRRFLDQPAQLSHELPMAAESQIGVDADLERPRAKLVQTFGLRTALQVQRHVRENRAVPEPEGLLREGRGTRLVTSSQRLGCSVYERFEDLRVENSATEVDPIAAPASLDGHAVRGESPPEARHVGLQAVRCGSRGTIAPDLIEQALGGDDLFPAEQQSCENSALLGPAELERAFSDRGFEPAENAKPERF